MKRLFKKPICITLCLALLLVCFGAFAPAGQSADYIGESANKYKVRILIIENTYFNPGCNAYGGGDGETYVNYGSAHIAANEDWCRVDYAALNGTGKKGSAYITLYDRDGDGRYNVVSSWGSSGGYFPDKDGILIDGFPTGFYTQYYKSGKAEGKYTVYLQVAKRVGSTWTWSEGTNTAIGDAAFSNSFDDAAISTYSGGVVSAMSTAVSDNNGGALVKAEGLVPSTAYPKAQSAQVEPSAAYAYSSVVLPKLTQNPVSNTLTVQNGPVDQYGVSMAASVSVSSSAGNMQGITNNLTTTTLSAQANRIGGEHNSETYNSQQITATVSWKQAMGESKSATASFTAVDCKYPVKWYEDDGTLFNETDYYYGCTPSLAVPEKECDEQFHYLNGTWNHAAEAVTESSDNTYTAQYEEVAHNYDTCVPIDNNAQYHLQVCSVEPAKPHTVQQAHHFREQVVAAACEMQGYTQYVCDECGYHYETNYTAALKHKWDEGIVTKQPTCTQTGEKTFTCKLCGTIKPEAEPISALGHDPGLRKIDPSDQQDGGLYYVCERCSAGYWAVSFDGEEYDCLEDVQYATPSRAASKSEDKVWAPTFNEYEDSTLGYNYAVRGAALKYVNELSSDEQPVRFTASVKVPDNVDFRIGSSGNVIKDIGFVFSQKDEVGNLPTIGMPKVMQLSIAERNKNAGRFNGLNWGGVSKHESAGITHLTFNLLLSINEINWQKEYVVRPYISYCYGGFEFTVYDSASSIRSVEYIANKVVNNEKEPLCARVYCQELLTRINQTGE